MKAQMSAENLKVVTAQELGVVSKELIKPEAFALWIRSLLQNWRQGTVGVKGRADVALSNKKPWKQKGTGRARAGTARSPLWRGGGITHGPQMRTRTLDIPKKLRSNILHSLVSYKLAQGDVVVGNWQVLQEKPSTRAASAFLKNVGLADKKITLFIPFEDKITFSSFINIPTVQVLFYGQENAYNLVSHGTWLVLNKDFEQFKEMVGKWH